VTPLKAAKAHCANYQPDGACLGIAFRDDLSMYRFRSGPCVFHVAPCQACPYFEEIVLPQVPGSVADEYRRTLARGVKTSVKPQSIKLCSECHRRELEPRRKYCSLCAKNKRREYQRQLMRRKRGLDVSNLALVSASESTAQNADFNGVATISPLKHENGPSLLTKPSAYEATF
jgi:cytochrome c553